MMQLWRKMLHGSKAWSASFASDSLHYYFHKCQRKMFISYRYIWTKTWQNQQNGCASSEDSDQPGHPHTLIRGFAVRMKKPWVLSYPLSAQQRFWSNWAAAQADLSLCWAQARFDVFVMLWLILSSAVVLQSSNEPPRDKTNKMACAPSEDPDQPGHPPSLIRVFAVHLKKARILSYPLGGQRRLIRLGDAQADLSPCWGHMPFCWFCHDAAQMWGATGI